MWLWLSLITAVFWAVGSFLLKKGVTDLSIRWVYCLNFLAFTGLWLVYWLIFGGFKFSLVVFLLSIAPAAGFIYQLAAYRKADVSMVASIGSIHPAVTAVLAVSLIGESLSLAQIGLIVLMVLGAMVISWPKNNSFKRMSWVWWSLGFGVLAGIVNLVSKIGVDMAGALSYSLMNSIWQLVFCLVMIMTSKDKWALVKVVRQKAGQRTILGTVIFNLGAISFFLAMGLGKVSLVMPMVNLYVPGLIILASIYLKEKMSLRQKLGAGVVVAGATVLSLVS